MAATITTTDVQKWVTRAAIADPTDPRAVIIAEVVPAVVAFINEETTVTGGVWSDRQRLAALMLAGRLYKRKASPEGVAGFGDLGVVRVLADDPDVSLLLARVRKVDGFS